MLRRKRVDMCRKGPTELYKRCSSPAEAVLPAPFALRPQETQRTRTAVAIATPSRPRVRFPSAQKYDL